jgi:hypothetical protein
LTPELWRSSTLEERNKAILLADLMRAQFMVDIADAVRAGMSSQSDYARWRRAQLANLPEIPTPTTPTGQTYDGERMARAIMNLGKKRKAS